MKAADDKKSTMLILSVFIYGEAFSYDWKGKMEIFSYDLANRYKNEYFYVLEEYYETFKHRDRNYLTSVMPNFVNTGFWETAFDRYFEWYETEFEKPISEQPQRALRGGCVHNFFDDCMIRKRTCNEPDSVSQNFGIRICQFAVEETN